MQLPLITLEEHFLSSASSNLQHFEEPFRNVPNSERDLRDLGKVRLQAMDEGEISLQVISHAPGALSVSECKSANDELAAAVKQNPGRFAGFATLPVEHPHECAGELERAVKQHGFVGALIDNHAGGRFFDGDDYLPMWQKAEELKVPVYLHPTFANDLSKYMGDYSKDVQIGLAGHVWGWHSETGLHVLRLFGSHLFDKCPGLKIIIGHCGEMLPFMLSRICALTANWPDQKRKFRHVYEENIWITTSGMFSLDPLRCILANTPSDHIMYSVDYPFASNKAGLEWIKELEKSNLMNREQLERYAYRNAEQLLQIRVEF